MKVLYVSSLISNKKMNKIIEESKCKPLQSIQKFHRLLCLGLLKNNMKVKTISIIPMSRKISKKTFWNEKKEKEDGIEYNYIPFVNLKVLRQICIFIFTIFKIIKESINERNNKIFICDMLTTTISYTTLLLSKIFRIKCIAIVTDLPRDRANGFKLYELINYNLQNKFDGYILLTEQMNKIVNTKNKPYIVIEGIADESMKNIDNTLENKYEKKVCIYAGGLYEKYGVKMLVEAFKQINNPNIELHLYGEGELDEYLKNINNEKIKYFGVVKNDKIIQEEIKATLLINPRFSTEEYTKYSFPSKNMEYMASGTPILTTKLPGMPKEYYNYIYTFENETIEGFKEKIEEILNISDVELMKKGKEAKEFVLRKKNNIIQTKEICNLINMER